MCGINALSASLGVWQLCGSSTTHSVHQSWCHKDWHIGKRQGLRLGCEAELRWHVEMNLWPPLQVPFHWVHILTGLWPGRFPGKLAVKHLSLLGVPWYSLSIATWFFLVQIHCVWEPGLSIISGETLKFKPVSPFSIPTHCDVYHGTYGRIPSPTASLILSLGNWHNWERRIRPQILPVLSNFSPNYWYSFFPIRFIQRI